MEANNLKEFLASMGMKHVHFAKLMHVGNSYMCQIINGNKQPGKRLSIDISKFTGGKINLPWNERKKPEKRVERKAEGE